MKKKKQHGSNYILKDGTRAASVTTIINSELGWNKQSLINWAKRLSSQGFDYDEELRDAGKIGTLVHTMIEADQKNQTVDTGDFTINQINTAKVAFGAYEDWVSKDRYTFLANEITLVNEDLRVGGTIDSIGKMGDDLVVTDYKTSKYGPYKEHIIQLGAYMFMYEAAQPNAKIAYGMVLRFGKEDGKFHQHKIKREKLDVGVNVFKHCVALYNLKKQM